MTFEEFNKKLQDVIKQLKKNAEKNKKDSKNSIARPVFTTISS